MLGTALQVLSAVIKKYRMEEISVVSSERRLIAEAPGKAITRTSCVVLVH